MRAGVIDIGSRSIKLLIGEVEAERIVMLEFLKSVVPMGQYTFLKGRISQEIIQQTVQVLSNYRRVLDSYDVSRIIVIATTAVREAANRDIFIDTVMRKTGFLIEVLTVGDIVYYIDAYLSYKLKDEYPFHSKNVMIAELGSGNLDISIMRKGFTLTNFGLPIGTLRMRQLMGRLDGSNEEVYVALEEYVENEFSYFKKVVPNLQLDDIILIDESYSPYLAQALLSKNKESDLYPLSFERLQALFPKIVDCTVEEIVRKYKIPAELADTTIAYLIILKKFFPLIENRNIYVLETSLAEAILANMLFDLELAKKYNKTNQLLAMAHFLCQRYNADLDHAKHVANIAKQLFTGLKNLLGLLDEHLLYLTLGAYLHDIGSFIHNRAHHKHTEYIISYLNLFRLSQDEINTIACIARYHRKNGPRSTHLLYSALPPDKQILVQKLSVLLRLANALDSSHKQKVKSLEVEINRKQDVSLVVQIQGNFLLERSEFLDKKWSFEDITGNKIQLLLKE